MKSGNGFSHDLQGRTGLEIPFFKVADTNIPKNKIEMLYAHNTVSLQTVSDFKFILHKPKSIVFPKVGAALLLNKRNILTEKSCIDNNMMSLYSNQSNHKFLYYAMLNVDFKRHHRIGGTVPSINESEVGSIPIAYPTLSEQTQIADFLDRKIEQIDELIRIKERRIELLQEQRTALINQAVTKGLDPNVEMKPSRVEWIGNIPKHWTVTRLKYVSNIPVTYGLNIESDKYTTEGFRLIRITDIDGHGGLQEKGVYLSEDYVPQEQILNSYDLLLSRSGATVGKSYLHLKKGKYTSAGYLVRFNFGDYCTSKFIYYVTLSHFYRNWLERQIIISTIQNVNGEKYSNFQLPIPLHPERKHIVNFLDHKTQQIDKLLSAEQRKIELLKEYRQSLISEAVTGKIDVRNEV